MTAEDAPFRKEQISFPADKGDLHSNRKNSREFITKKKTPYLALNGTSDVGNGQRKENIETKIESNEDLLSRKLNSLNRRVTV